MQEWPELLLIDKPHGITSFDVIRRLRRVYTDTHDGQKAPKIGHAGTLDPLATGLMLLGVGQGTKTLADLIKLDKEYIAEIRIGESRTTGDLEGEVMESCDFLGTKESLTTNINLILGKFAMTHCLPVSAYSAIKVDGVPMYKRARQAEKKGELVQDVPVREMTVRGAELLSVEVTGKRAVLIIKFTVASGTYIRSLAEEIGNQLGCPACLQNLRRTKIGQYLLEDAYQIDDLK